MFNPLKPEELILAVGSVLRSTARSEDVLDEFQRSQLLSAYSITRLLAAEQQASARMLGWLRGAVLDALGDERGAAPGEAREAIQHAADAVEIGDALAVLLEQLRAAPGSGSSRLRARLQEVMCTMAELELAALASRSEPGRPS